MNSKWEGTKKSQKSTQHRLVNFYAIKRPTESIDFAWKSDRQVLVNNDKITSKINLSISNCWPSRKTMDFGRFKLILLNSLSLSRTLKTALWMCKLFIHGLMRTFCCVGAIRASRVSQKSLFLKPTEIF